MEYKEYQGVAVLDSDPNVPCRHPRWGYESKPNRTHNTLSGASLLGLADGTFLVVCDDCGFNGITGNAPYAKPEGEVKSIIKQADSVMAHKSGTHWRKAGRPQAYSDELIKVAIKVYLKWKNTRVRGWASGAANELNTMGFKPYHGAKWTSSILTSLAGRYADNPKFKNIKAGPMDSADREFIASMVLEAAARETSATGTHLADNVRITTTRERTPIVVAVKDETKSMPVEQREDDVEEVASTDGGPTLSFGNEPTQTKKLTISSAAAASALQMADERQPSLFSHVADLPDGTLLFTYDGALMAAKPVKGIEV